MDTIFESAISKIDFKSEMSRADWRILCDIIELLDKKTAYHPDVHAAEIRRLLLWALELVPEVQP